MTTTYAIPLQPTPQTLTVTIANVTYNLRLAYQNVEQGGWILDISDASNDPIVCGIPLVTGADLLAQYGYLGFGFSLYTTTAGDPYAVPTFSSLGNISGLYAVVP